jgi:hypothetical protein
MDFSKIPTKLNFVDSTLLKKSKYSNIMVPTPKKNHHHHLLHLLERTTSLSSSTSTITSSSDSILGADYQISDNDVVCGRGKGYYNKPGNRRFRQIVQGFVGQYEQARTKLDKTMVLSAIVDRVMEQGRFIKRKAGGVWVEIGEDQAREKVGHTIREAMAANSDGGSSSSGGSTTSKGSAVLLSDDSERTQVPSNTTTTTSAEPDHIVSLPWEDLHELQPQDDGQAIQYSRRNSRSSFASLRGSIVLPSSIFDDALLTGI